MDLTSWQYLLLVGVLVALYYGTHMRQRWLLLIVNVIFIIPVMHNSIFALLELLFACAITWYGGRKIHADQHRKMMLLMVIGVDLLLLIMCKFVSMGLVPMIGISYYTLSLISYAVDIYWKIIPAESNYFNMIVAVSYFPLLTSGPIVKYGQIIEQLNTRHEWSYDQVRRGMIRVMFGICKKLVLASRFAMLEKRYFMNWESYYGKYIWLAMAEFFMELYFDFSGCMDIIMGTSQILGISLPENFDQPFFSKSVSEFWRRWHITLGAWFKEYVLYPILKSDVWVGLQDFWKKYLPKRIVKNIFTWSAMFILWILIGIWHGVGVTFLCEGLFFGSCIIVEQLFEKQGRKIKRWFQIHKGKQIYAMFQMCKTAVLICVGLLFFHAENIQMALGCLKHAIVWNDGFTLQGIYGNGTVDFIGFALVFGIWLLANIVSYMSKQPIIDLILKQKAIVRWSCYYALVLSICFWGEFGSVSFIYAKF